MSCHLATGQFVFNAAPRWLEDLNADVNREHVSAFKTGSLLFKREYDWVTLSQFITNWFKGQKTLEECHYKRGIFRTPGNNHEIIGTCRAPSASEKSKLNFLKKAGQIFLRIIFTHCLDPPWSCTTIGFCDYSLGTHTWSTRHVCEGAGEAKQVISLHNCRYVFQRQACCQRGGNNISSPLVPLTVMQNSNIIFLKGYSSP